MKTRVNFSTIAGLFMLFVVYSCDTEEKEVREKEVSNINFGATNYIYLIGFPQNPNISPLSITIDDSKKTVRLIVDLTGNKNEDLVRKHGTNHFPN